MIRPHHHMIQVPGFRFVNGKERPCRGVLRGALLAAVYFILATTSCGDESRERAEPTPVSVSGLQTDFVRIKAELRGDFGQGYPWTLEVDAGGNCELRTYRSARHFVWAPEFLSAVKEKLAEAGFVALPRRIGRAVPDGAERRIVIYTGKEEYGVTLYFLPNIKEASERRAARRFLDCWSLIRGSFDDAEAAKDHPSVVDFKP